VRIPLSTWGARCRRELRFAQPRWQTGADGLSCAAEQC